MGRDLPSAIALLVSVREGLERYCHQLRDALGEQLVAVILYGGLAKGEYTTAPARTWLTSPRVS